MLRLAASPAVIDHQLPGHRARHLRTEILLHHAKREIDPGAHSSRGPNGAVDDEDAVLLYVDRGETALQFARVGPVGRRTPAVQQARLAEDEGTGADRGHPPASRERPAQK